MSTGIFPGWKELNRRTVRAPVNPMDKSTIISIFPVAIDETKVTLQPGRFKIPAGSYEKPTLLTIGPSSWWREIDPEQPLLEIPVASVLVADSIVRDYCNGLLACDMGDNMPGLFFIPGEVDNIKLVKDYSHLLKEADRKQRNWFTELVKIADIAWSRTQGNPLSLNELMKLSAKHLGIDDRDWLKAYKAIDMVRCFACGTMKNPRFPVCAQCRAVDPDYKGDIKFAG